MATAMATATATADGLTFIRPRIRFLLTSFNLAFQAVSEHPPMDPLNRLLLGTVDKGVQTEMPPTEERLPAEGEGWGRPVRVQRGGVHAVERR